MYAEGTVPASAYRTPSDVRTIVVPNLLLVRTDMPANNACAITRLRFDKKADLEIEARWNQDGAVCLNTPRIKRHPAVVTGIEIFPLISDMITDECLHQLHPLPKCSDSDVDDVVPAHLVSANPL